MKYLLIFLISLALFSPAYAAISVKGTVPELQPLQPPPSNLQPNFSHNIMSSSSDFVGAPSPVFGPPTGEDMQPPLENPEQQGSGVSLAGSFLGGKAWLAGLILLGVLFAAIFYVLRRNDNEK